MARRRRRSYRRSDTKAEPCKGAVSTTRARLTVVRSRNRAIVPSTRSAPGRDCGSTCDGTEERGKRKDTSQRDSRQNVRVRCRKSPHRRTLAAVGKKRNLFLGVNS